MLYFYKRSNAEPNGTESGGVAVENVIIERIIIVERRIALEIANSKRIRIGSKHAMKKVIVVLLVHN